MSTETQAGATPQQDAVKANWDALSEDFIPVATQETTKAESKEDVQQKDIANPDQIQDAKQEETTPNKEETADTQKEEEKKEVTDEKKDEAKDEKVGAETKETTEELLSAKDIKDVPNQFEEGSWGALAKDLKVDIQEDSYEAFVKGLNDKYIPREEFEKVADLSLEKIYASVKPETAVALKLMEMGVPEERVFEASREIDQYLSLSPAELIRADLQLKKGEGWTDELIDAKMEELAADPKKMGLLDAELRIMLNNQKKAIAQERTELLQQYEQDKQKAVLHQKQQEATRFNEALDKLQNFFGQPVSKDVKEAIRAKYNSGSYSDIVSNPAAVVNAIMYKEYGDKLSKLLQNKASEEARVETRKKLLNVPPVNGTNGKRVDTNAVNQNDNNWAALEDFK